MNSENSRTSEYHVLECKLADKLDLRRGEKSVALSNLSIYYAWRNIKKHKTHSESVDDTPIEIFVSKNENRLTFKIKNEYYLQFLTPETMKLLGST